MYQLIKNYLSNTPTAVRRLTDGASIPFDKDNTDYVEYLKWIELGNQPLPADE